MVALLKDGDYISINSPSTDYIWFTKHKEAGDERDSGICVKKTDSRSYIKAPNFPKNYESFPKDKVISYMTDDQIKWYKECKKLDKYINFEEFMKQNEINIMLW